MRTLEGKIIAVGDLTQLIIRERAVSHLVYRFRDGSIDDETASFSQHGTFRLISDHHIQKGPSFPKPLDISIKAATGLVTVRYEDNHKQKVETEHMDLPPDLANGIVLNVLKNISPASKGIKLSYLVANPKPSLVTLAVYPDDTETFRVAGFPRQAVHFLVKVELNGLAGVLAPIMGKSLPVFGVWMSAGEAPAFVKLEGPSYLGGPNWRTEMTSPVWQEPAVSK